LGSHSDTVEDLILDLIQWVGREERTYHETMDAWRTSCPRLPVWEEATARAERQYHWAKFGQRGSLLKILQTLVFVLGACGHSRPHCKTVQPGQYFPLGTFSASTEEWYGGQLCAMREEPLAHSAADEAYRFLWLRSFHHPVSVRIEASSGTSALIGVELDGAGGYDPGTTKLRTKRSLSEQEWTTLVATINAAAFWDVPTEDAKDEEVEDGAQWIIEGHRHGTYHVVERSSPGSGPIRAVGEAFLRAAHLSFPANEMY
jgi:hypothetical protein